VRRCFCPYPDPVIVPLTGHQYEIEAGHYRATVTELGAGLRELAVSCLFTGRLAPCR